MLSRNTLPAVCASRLRCLSGYPVFFSQVSTALKEKDVFCFLSVKSLTLRPCSVHTQNLIPLTDETHLLYPKPDCQLPYGEPALDKGEANTE